MVQSSLDEITYNAFVYAKRKFIGFQLVDHIYQFIIHYYLHIFQISSLNKEIGVISKKYKFEFLLNNEQYH